MKKLIVVLLLLLLPLIGGFSTDMEFYVSGGGGFNAARVEDDELFRTSAMYDIDLSVLNFKFADKHTIGMPLIFKSYSETRMVLNKQLDPYWQIGVGLTYKYSFTDYLELMTKAAVYYNRYTSARGSLFGMDLGVELWWMPIEYIGLRVPMTFGITKNEISFNLGLGAVIRYTKEDI